MPNIRRSISATILAIAISSTAFAGDISGGRMTPGDISGGKTGDISGGLMTPGDISGGRTVLGDISGGLVELVSILINVAP